MTRYLDIHVVQPVPPSNLNRDDAGSPKQATFGGVRRARVSSQAWKRAARKHFSEHQPTLEQATRTQRISRILTDRIVERTGIDGETAERITAALRKSLGIKDGKRKDETPYLLFFGRAQLEPVVDQIEALLPGLADLEGDDLEAALADISLQTALGEGHPVDVALFGRMVADLPNLNVDASVQVAHALSTHPVETEFDYFTAVDDEKDRNDGDDAGAGMIGTVEFNSSTLYRYATLGVDLLAENLDGDAEATAKAARAFVEGFVKSMPTGKQNTFANRTLPSAVVVVVRDDQPVNLVSAFEDPVRPPHVPSSLQRLVDELRETSDLWGSSPVQVLATYRPADAGDGAEEVLGAPVPFDELLDGVEAASEPAPVS